MASTYISRDYGKAFINVKRLWQEQLHQGTMARTFMSREYCKNIYVQRLWNGHLSKALPSIAYLLREILWFDTNSDRTLNTRQHSTFKRLSSARYGYQSISKYKFNAWKHLMMRIGLFTHQMRYFTYHNLTKCKKLNWLILMSYPCTSININIRQNT